MIKYVVHPAGGWHFLLGTNSAELVIFLTNILSNFLSVLSYTFQQMPNDFFQILQVCYLLKKKEDLHFEHLYKKVDSIMRIAVIGH